ncbi:MAG: WGR domain-containing protein [Methylomicrobium sp.]
MLTPVAYLEAKDASRNIHRAYSIAYGQDLFGNWVVETTYERIGGKGRMIVTVVDSEDEALQYVQNPSNAGSLLQNESASATKIGWQ